MSYGAAMALGSVLVTGAAGALGGAVCQRLRADGWRVVAVVRGEGTVDGAVTVRADVTDRLLELGGLRGDGERDRRFDRVEARGNLDREWH